MATATEEPKTTALTTAQPPAFRSVAEYIQAMATSDPQTALAIAISEQRRAESLAVRLREENKAMSDVEFDKEGRIVRASMLGLMGLAKFYADSQIIPEHFRKRPADCFIACQLAYRLGAEPLMVMQSTYIVHGKCGFEGKFVTALLNTSGRIKGRVRYKLEGEGRDRKCTAYATDAVSGEEVFAEVSWAMVEAEGWHLEKKTQKSKWVTLPDLMFHYRAATFLARIHYPEVLMGMRTMDEIEDEPMAVETDPQPRTLTELTKRLTGVDVADQADEGFGETVEQAEVATSDKPDLSKPNGNANHVTDSSQWRKLDLPPGALEILEAAVSAGDSSKVQSLCIDGIQSAKDNEYLAAAFQTAMDSAKEEIRRKEMDSGKEAKKGKKQGSLVE